MDEQLKNLKRAMKKNVLNGLNFKDDHKKKIKQQIMKLNASSDEEILIAVLQLLVQEKTGFELCRLVRARGIERFEKNEGILYMFLHRLEQKGFVKADWKSDDAKYYQLSKKGKRLLIKVEDKEYREKTVLAELFEG
jgi:hypothetical protein